MSIKFILFAIVLVIIAAMTVFSIVIFFKTWNDIKRDNYYLKVIRQLRERNLVLYGFNSIMGIITIGILIQILRIIK